MGSFENAHFPQTKKIFESELINEEIKNTIENLSTIELNQYTNNLEKLQKSDLNKLQVSTDKLKTINLKELYDKLKNNAGVLNEKYFKALEKVKDLNLEDELNLVKKIKEDKEEEVLVPDINQIENKNKNINNDTLEQYELIVQYHKAKKFGDAFNAIDKEKSKIDKVINILKEQLIDVIKSKNVSVVNEIETKLNKYKKIIKDIFIMSFNNIYRY